LVGGELEVPEPDQVAEHQVWANPWTAPPDEVLLCMRIRLFADLKTPVYRVVVGRPISA
jgi:hypothetical protein